MNTRKLLDGTLAELFDIETAEVSFVPAGANGLPLLAVKGLANEFSSGTSNTSKAETPDWRCAADRSLDINTELSWDGAAAAKRVFEWAGWTDDAETSKPDSTKARRAFLFYDAANAELRGSYKAGFADIVDGELVAIAAGLSQARSRINQVKDVPADVIEAGQAVLDHYADLAEGTAEKGTDLLADLARKMLTTATPEHVEIAKLMDAAATKIAAQALQIRDLRRKLDKSEQRVQIAAHVPESVGDVPTKTESPWPAEWRGGKERGQLGRD
jgi:hypothetical protein